MQGNMKITGADELLAQMRNIADRVPENARKTMHRGADQIERLAKRQAPVDKHNLENAIHQEVAYEYRGRLKIDVVAGGFSGGVDVDRYATQVHENYDDAHPGKGTAAKREANPDVLVGSKFLQRAIDTVKPKLERDMIDTVVKEMKVLEK